VQDAAWFVPRGQCFRINKTAATKQIVDNNVQTVEKVMSKSLSKVRSMSLESWKTLFEIVGLILLALTFLAGLGAWYFGRKVNEVQAETLRKFDLQLTEAKIDLTKQQGRAVQAEKDVAELKRQNLVAEGRLEDEKSARVKIEEAVAWRELSKKDQLEIGSRLNPFSPQIAKLSYNANDSEASTFCLDIVATLRLSKWNVPDPLELSRMYPPSSVPLPVGIFVSSTGDKASRDARDALAHELSSHGFDTTKWPQTDPGSIPTVFISVEHRPKGAQGEAKIRNANK